MSSLRSARTWLADPGTDFAAAGVTGMLVGRMVLYIGLAWSCIASALWWTAFLVVVFAVFDGLIHTTTLRCLTQYLRIEMATYALAFENTVPASPPQGVPTT